MLKGDGAAFSPDRKYRYVLTRHVRSEKPMPNPKMIPAMWCGFNPSKADEKANDPTVTREVNFSRVFGATFYLKVNLFARRAIDPANLTDTDPIGPHNDQHIFAAIKWVLERKGTLIAAWGGPKGSANVKALFGLQQEKMRKLAKWRCLGLTKGGSPLHPLYLAKDAELIDWNP